MSWFLAFAGFAALIILHEFGHFAAAKSVGMRVERFSLFFPPIAASIKRGETEYAIGTVPLGGYVKITGMNPNEELTEEVAHRAYYRQPVWKRIVVIAAGPAMNLLIAFVILLALFMFKGRPVADTTKVLDVQDGKPASTVLQKGDRVLAVDGVTGDAAKLRARIGTHKCAQTPPRQGCAAAMPVRVTIERDGTTVTRTVTPRYDAQAKRTLLGFQFGEYQKEGLLTASGSSVDGMWQVSEATVSAIGKLFYDSKARKQVSGVVGSYETTRQSIETSGFVQTMTILAIISLSLAIVNLFPFLPLDGGHIFWALAEKVRGRAIPFAVMERASVVGFMLVIVLFAIGLTNDIGRLQGEGFGVR
jgi:regulator of sigma E protease